jgi:hypothetical protein
MVLDVLSDKQRSAAVYMSKFAAAWAVGLFDAELNYLWNETVRNLRDKVGKFDLEYFFDSVATDPSQRSKLREMSDLEKLGDWELVRGCHKTGIINETGFRHLDYIRNMRNHASAAHPNQNQITGLQIIGWLEACILEVLAREPSGSLVEVGRLLNSIREHTLTDADIPPIVTSLPQLPIELSASLLRAILGMYTDEKIGATVRSNIKLVAKAVWEVAGNPTRQEAGLKQQNLAENDETTRAGLDREFLEIVGGMEFLPESTRAVEVSTTLDSLTKAHHGLDNFTNEELPGVLSSS